MFSKRLLSLVLVALVFTVAVAAGRAYLVPQEMPQPTEHHKMILKGVGEWEGSMTMFGMGPEPVTLPAKETVTALGEFWTQSHFSCDIMGMAFNGSATSGYDTAKKKFVGTWIDNMSTHITIMEGDYDHKAGTLTMRYEGPHPQTGQMVPHRNVSKFTGDSYAMEFFIGEGDAETKTMTIDMKRKKSAAADKMDKMAK
jgi:hypothetical protein